jgi:Domain of unknown function (DUF5916)
MRALLLVFILLPCLLSAQNKPGKPLHIKKAKGEIILDGKLDEPDWHEAEVAKDWFLNYPVDTARAPYQTEARVTFDDQFFYVSFVCYDDDSPDLINSLRRDFDFPLNDNVGINFGPYNDGLNGFFFALTPAGVQREGIISGGGAGGDAFNSFWDNKWYSKVVRYDDRWIAEAAIPWKSFRYKDGLKEWNILFDRSDKKRNLRSSWIRTPIQFHTGMFAFSGKLIWDDPVPPAHTNISFIPYVAGSTSKDAEANPEVKSSELQAGFDAKVGVTPSLNLDLTLNPDFSQVEVDQQVINLTRFEFRFPERRQFFLENSDLFSRAGLPEARPFFSRRVGLVKDSSGLYQKVPIIYGARLSGSFNEKWRLSVMNMQTKEDLSLGLPAQNYTVSTVQRNFWRQSSFAVTFVNKESLGVGYGDSLKYFHENIFQETMMNGNSLLKRNTFNRVLDFDLEMLSPDNKWHSSSFFAKSFDDFNSKDNIAVGSFFEYSTRNLYIRLRPAYVAENFNAEAGFVPSSGVYPGQIKYYSSVAYMFYPESKTFVSTGPTVELNQIYIPGGTLTDRDYIVSYDFNLLNTAKLQFSYNYVFQKLTNDFSPLGSDEYQHFLAGEEYSWHTVSASFESNTRNIFNFALKTVYGGFYNGTNFNVNGQLNVRYQPYGNVSLQFDYNDLNLPDNYGKENLFLIGPRVDLTLTDKLFLTTYVQYNNLLDNMNLNARFQWRYKPASDLFIVYTENYFPNGLTSKNRALVFKLTYWLNL